MKIVYLASTKADIEWMRRYYSSIFPAGAKRAREHFRACEKMLEQNPLIGHQSDIAGVRELVVAHTPFVFVYRVAAERVEVLRGWDGRGERSNSQNSKWASDDS